MIALNIFQTEQEWMNEVKREVRNLRNVENFISFAEEKLHPLVGAFLKKNRELIVFPEYEGDTMVFKPDYEFTESFWEGVSAFLKSDADVENVALFIGAYHGDSARNSFLKLKNN